MAESILTQRPGILEPGRAPLEDGVVVASALWEKSREKMGGRQIPSTQSKWGNVTEQECQPIPETKIPERENSLANVRIFPFSTIFQAPGSHRLSVDHLRVLLVLSHAIFRYSKWPWHAAQRIRDAHVAESVFHRSTVAVVQVA